MRFALLCLLGAVCAASALPTANDKQTASAEADGDLLAGIYNDCHKKDAVKCTKNKIVTYVDKMLDAQEPIALTEGISIVKTPNTEEGAPRYVCQCR